MGKVPESISVFNIPVDSKAGVAENLKAKLATLDTLSQVFKSESLDLEEANRQVIVFHNYKAHALQIRKALRSKGLRSVFLNAEQSQ